MKLSLLICTFGALTRAATTPTADLSIFGNAFLSVTSSNTYGTPNSLLPFFKSTGIVTNSGTFSNFSLTICQDSFAHPLLCHQMSSYLGAVYVSYLEKETPGQLISQLGALRTTQLDRLIRTICPSSSQTPGCSVLVSQWKLIKSSPRPTRPTDTLLSSGIINLIDSALSLTSTSLLAPLGIREMSSFPRSMKTLEYGNRPRREIIFNPRLRRF
ncbi:hypothetical protein TREMEDRAFT_63713 [Tremella mesenterica DSM 1558]|uniref:uncharacterized protein n=1 Tax=Tremella mesenterica (strain ATCC 24925 / CBS 8224 / DSM 1558 / NBRC 9311 / NRRL Y-6157 / RJB 2259-6 / UBC 559-6) TaxID=578456 RepID=UPI0003F49515|nr:uncharacterized protein TREMEDRAFT_63713 [Tremella mesenterica DSM 1558]EIW67821.1 hypothetical protein TREMEDRAFT_63713 [Tremella mesenterica DSM 1558]